MSLHNLPAFARSSAGYTANRLCSASPELAAEKPQRWPPPLRDPSESTGHV